MSENNRFILVFKDSKNYFYYKDILTGDKINLNTFELEEMLNSLWKQTQRFEKQNKRLSEENEQLKEICDNKQKHIVHLENKIHRIREYVKKLEGLYHYRGIAGIPGDDKKECYQFEKKYNQLKKEIKELSEENKQLKSINHELKISENDYKTLNEVIDFADDLFYSKLSSYYYNIWKTFCENKGVKLE